MHCDADEVRKERNKALKKDVALRLAGMIHKVSLLLVSMAAAPGLVGSSCAATQHRASMDL